MFNSLKVKVVTAFSLIMVFFTILLLCIIYINGRDQLLRVALEKSSEVSSLHAELLSQEFEQYVAVLKMVNNTSQINENDKEGVLTVLNQLLKVGGGDFINAIFIDANFNLTDAAGKQSKATHPLFLHGDMWDNKEYNITVPLHTRFESSPVIIVAVPVTNELGKWKGTLAVAIPLTLISEKLSSIKLAKGSYAWLSDANGLVVSHPRQEMVMSTSLSNLQLPDYTGFDNIMRQTKLQDHGYGEYHDFGLNVDKIITFSSIPALPKWTLFVTTKKTEIFHDMYDLLCRIVITSCLLMLVFFIVIMHLANKIVKPISLLTKQVKKAINNPNSDFKRVDAKDEIGQLSDVFYIIFKRINTYTTNLEEMISQRTEEISIKNKLLNEQNNKLEKLASIDPLTKLYNRRAFMVFVNKELSRAKRHSLSITLAILDIDHFKKINDTYGHNVGDDILQKFAEELILSLRNEDVVCRWGGEEFIILMTKTTSKASCGHLNDIREKIAKMHFPSVEHITFSAGMVDLVVGESFKSSVNRVDEALYKAKRSGRNCVVRE